MSAESRAASRQTRRNDQMLHRSRKHPRPADIPTPEDIAAETERPLDADDLEIIESVLVPAGVLGTTLAKIRRMRREATR